MHLVLENYIVGLSSFWNLTGPAIALVVLVVGFLVWGLAKQPGASRIGVVVVAVGLLAFAVSIGVDASRNTHDVHQLEAAAHNRYDATISYTNAIALFDSSNVTRATVGGQSVLEYGKADIESGDKTVTAYLDRLQDGSFVLAADNKELPVDGA